MTAEITTKSQATILKGETRVVRENVTRTDDMTGSRVFRNSPSIPTTAAGTLIDFGDLSTYGLCYFLNKDDTNFVEIGLQVAATFYPLCKLLPGQECKVWLGTASVYARADTAAVELDVQAAER